MALPAYSWRDENGAGVRDESGSRVFDRPILASTRANEARAAIVEAESRALTVEAESRTAIVPSENRSVFA